MIFVLYVCSFFLYNYHIPIVLVVKRDIHMLSSAA